jgi:mannose-6-phosphate isomerase-like protein (cupin superfamily)
VTVVERIAGGIPHDARTPFERWAQDELKLEIIRDYFAGPLGTLAVRPWPGRNLDAVFIDLIGAESLAGMFVAELRPGQSSVPVRQIYDETFFVLKGTGTTTIETPHGTIQFEWGPHSLFAIPLNCKYQLHNGSGVLPARLVSTNTLPIVYSLYRDSDFVYNSNHDFERFSPQAVADPTAATIYEPDAKKTRSDVDVYDTLFIPDVLRMARGDASVRGEGTSLINIETVNSVISDHVCEVPGRRFFRPHRHGPSASIFTVSGTGYSLLWTDGSELTRFDWPENDVGVIIPPNMWWHGHFVTSPNAIQVAVKLRSRMNPINHLYENTHVIVSEGGTVLRFEDMDPVLRTRIWDMFVDECKRKGFDAVPPIAD